MDCVLLGGVALAAGAILQYYFLGFDTLNNRPRSFLGHYMTASGIMMGIVVLAAARLAFGVRQTWEPSSRDLRSGAWLVATLALLTVLQAADLFAIEGERLFVAGLATAAVVMTLARGAWPSGETGASLAVLAIPVSVWALILSRTRNAWLGALVGLIVVALLRARRVFFWLLAAIGLVVALRPTPMRDRLTITDASSRDRYFMWQAAIDMIRDKPVFGQGPRMVEKMYPTYRWPGAAHPETSHLHNNALQISAERGLPCLAWWLWWVAAAMGDAYRETRRDAFGSGWVAAGALGLLVAILVAGLFEYNFGDSEILMLILLVSALPYALRREREGAGQREVLQPAT
jgi:O-antigen ligase